MVQPQSFKRRVCQPSESHCKIAKILGFYYFFFWGRSFSDGQWLIWCVWYLSVSRLYFRAHSFPQLAHPFTFISLFSKKGRLCQDLHNRFLNFSSGNWSKSSVEYNLEEYVADIELWLRLSLQNSNLKKIAVKVLSVMVHFPFAVNRPFIHFIVDLKWGHRPCTARWTTKFQQH